MTANPTIYRADYTAPAYVLDDVSLALDIGTETVTVDAALAFRPNPLAEGSGQTLRLDGVELITNSVLLNGHPVEYRIDGETLVIDGVPDAPFTLQTQVVIRPFENQALMGLYRSGDMVCTQCEAEGFRRITWYPDRPDVMARFTVTLTANQTQYPILLSNGNQTDHITLPDGRHRAVWVDPFPKPSYLFAVVAGDLALVEGSFTTRSGRVVALRFWVEHGNEDQVGHAVTSLQKSMKWDEDTFGLEYDLDVYNVVAVSHFNMGAMENKSLNVFNSKYVLAKRETATDDDFLAIESVIAHEYFHNWTGNRVTCRDWFQLTLKEGLTVFRDQEFSADMNSRAVVRMSSVSNLRAGQFPEDNGPMAHAIRPDSYQEISNFYTATVYQKGAEVIRMIHTLIGPQAFRRGMDLYFQRHDGQAVTCEDFIVAMEVASGVDLTQFRRWYGQAGTPQVSATWAHDDANRTLRLTLSQYTKPTPGQTEKQPFHIPVALGLLDKAGHDVPLHLAGGEKTSATTRILNLKEESQTFVFEDIAEPVVPSFLRGYSAPVFLNAPQNDENLAFLMAHDSDPVSRWDAGQTLANTVLLKAIESGSNSLDPAFIDAWGRVLSEFRRDPAFTAEALSLPSEGVLGEKMAVIDVDGVHRVRSQARLILARQFQGELKAIHDLTTADDLDLSPTAIGSRRLRNTALSLLAELGAETQARAEAQFHAATCMTNQLAALWALIMIGPEAAAPALNAFYEQWQSEPLVVNKWLGLQAAAPWGGDVLGRVTALQQHPGYDAGVPNKIYALVGGFTANPWAFHQIDGAGYAFVADQVIDLNARNPQVAARMVRSLIRWRRYDPVRQTLMKTQLERIAATSGLSRDVAEIVSKALA